MKANSNKIPEAFITTKEKNIFNYSIKEVVKEDMNGSRTSFDYDYVEIRGEVTRDKLISAIIQNKYSKDTEIALLNNKMINKDVSEYDEYQAFRAEVKIIVDSVL